MVFYRIYYRNLNATIDHIIDSSGEKSVDFFDG